MDRRRTSVMMLWLSVVLLQCHDGEKEGPGHQFPEVSQEVREDAGVVAGVDTESETVVCRPSCEGRVCGDDGCGGSCWGGVGPECSKIGICVDGQCVCQPACESKDCGEDGCGGSCGECDGTQDLCVDGQCVCQLACEGKDCGVDGCGGSCGECTGSQDLCVDGQCMCQPACEGMACGEDGCGGSCGECDGSQDLCVDGQCVCQPACVDSSGMPLSCGPDGCGGLCGECLDDWYCGDQGVCLPPVELCLEWNTGSIATYDASMGCSNFTAARAHSMVRYDLSDPSALVEVCSVELGSTVNDVSTQGVLSLVALASGEVCLINSDCEVLECLDLPGIPKKVKYGWDTSFAFLEDSSIVILDHIWGCPGSMCMGDVVAGSGLPHDVAIENGYLYVAHSCLQIWEVTHTWIGDSIHLGLEIVVDFLQPQCCVYHGVATWESYLYAGFVFSLEILDVSDPDLPVQLFHPDPGYYSATIDCEYPMDKAYHDGHGYLVVASSVNITILDLNPGTEDGLPVIKAQLQWWPPPDDGVKSTRNPVFCDVPDDQGLERTVVSGPVVFGQWMTTYELDALTGTLDQVGITQPGNPYSMSLASTKGFLVTGDGFVLNPANGQVVAELVQPHSDGVVTAQEERVFILERTGFNTRLLRVLEVGEDGNGTLLGQLELSQPEGIFSADLSPTDLSANGTLLAAAILGTGEYSGVVLIDVSDPTAPAHLSTIEVSAWSAMLNGELLYVGLTGDAGLNVYDVTNPSSPVLLDSDSGFTALGMTLSGDHLFVSSGSQGLRIYQAGPSLTLTAALPLPGNAFDVSVAEDVAFVGMSTGGIAAVFVAYPPIPILLEVADVGPVVEILATEDRVVLGRRVYNSATETYHSQFLSFSSNGCNI